MNNEDILQTVDLDKINKFIEERSKSKKVTNTVPLTPLERMHDSKSFPTEPINPTTLSDKVSEKLKSFGNVVPNKTPAMVEELCRSFNECIRLNKEGESQTLILSPKTGSAKSVSSKMYVSLLQAHASIIVVYTVKEAIETCEDINKWSGDNNYARCTYRISKENKDKPVRVNARELKKFRCIVISHSLFKLANDKIGIENLSTYNGHKREFVLIDERIDLSTEVTFSLSSLEHLLKLLNSINESLQLPLVDNEIKYLNSLQESFEEMKDLKELTLDFEKAKAVQRTDLKRFIHMDKGLQEEFNIKDYDFNNFYKVLNETTINLQKMIDPLSLLGDKIDSKEIEKNLKAHLDKLSNILKKDFYYFAQSNTKKGPIIMTTENILNSFGSSVVLDATATVNALYDDKVFENQETVKHISTTDTRRYNNFIIHKCEGIPQGKYSVYESLSQGDLNTVIKIYQRIAYSIKGSKDKLLIITHKDFKELLKKKITKSGIEFTHWGNHRGKNDWSHCNKILVIGWLFLPSEVHYRNYINAINGTPYMPNDKLKEVKSTYEITQIADDLVQGVNRGMVRKSISTDGDCAESEVYLFYPSSELGNSVMECFENEFEGATILPWDPIGITIIQKLAKSYDNIEKLVNHIERKVNELGEIKQSSVQSYFDDESNIERLRLKEEGMVRSTLSNAITHKVFTPLLQTKGIHRVKHNGKSFKFEKINKISSS